MEQNSYRYSGQNRYTSEAQQGWQSSQSGQADGARKGAMGAGKRLRLGP